MVLGGRAYAQETFPLMEWKTIKGRYYAPTPGAQYTPLTVKGGQRHVAHPRRKGG